MRRRVDDGVDEEREDDNCVDSKERENGSCVVEEEREYDSCDDAEEEGIDDGNDNWGDGGDGDEWQRQSGIRKENKITVSVTPSCTNKR